MPSFPRKAACGKRDRPDDRQICGCCPGEVRGAVPLGLDVFEFIIVTCQPSPGAAAGEIALGFRRRDEPIRIDSRISCALWPGAAKRMEAPPDRKPAL